MPCGKCCAEQVVRSRITSALSIWSYFRCRSPCTTSAACSLVVAADWSGGPSFSVFDAPGGTVPLYRTLAGLVFVPEHDIELLAAWLLPTGGKTGM